MWQMVVCLCKIYVITLCNDQVATHSSPVAVPSVLNTCTVISVDDGLLRTSTGCAGPLFSS